MILMNLSASLSLSAALLLSTSFAAHAGKITLSAVGDIMLAGSGAATFARAGYQYPFAATSHELQRADISIGNLEAPLATGGNEFTDKKFRFKVNPKAAGALKKAGFSVLTLANNHIMDFGSRGLQETLEHLDRHAISYAGAGGDIEAARKPALLERNGKKVAFLSYSLTHPVEFFAGVDRAGTAPGYSRYFREDIRKARSSADYVVVSFHWGAERAVHPKPYQTETARRAVDAGADLVIGHHPHVLQGVERYRGGLILYSLGNFAFGSLSRHADASVMARVVLDGGVREVELIPLNVRNTEVRFQPNFLKGKRGREVISRINLLSRQWNTKIVFEGGRYLVKPDKPGLGQAVR